MEPQEYWIATIIITSCFLSLVETVLSATDGATTSYYGGPGVVLIPGVLGFFTILMHLITLRKWKMTVMWRRGTPIPQVVYSVGLCTFTFLFALFWFIIAVVAFVRASLVLTGRAIYTTSTSTSSSSSSSHYDMGPVGTWWEALLAYIISGTLWAEFGLGVYYRRRFLKHTQPQAAPINPQNKILKDTHEKVLFWLMFACITVSYIELGLSFGDGWFGSYNLWMVPVAVGLTELLHAIALPMWKNTTKNRRGTINPSSIYSLTLAVLLCLLALLWVAAAIVSFLLAAEYGAKFYTSRSGEYHGVLLNCVRWVAAGVALFVSLLLWTEFGLVVYYRTLFLRRIRRVQNIHNLGDGYANANANDANAGTYDANTKNKGSFPNNQTNANHYSTGTPYEQPSLPPLTYNPNYQPPFPSAYGYNPTISPFLGPPPLLPPPFYNPVYQPPLSSPPPMTMNPTNPMLQKDAGA